MVYAVSHLLLYRLVMQTAAFHPGLKQTLHAGAYLLFSMENLQDSTFGNVNTILPPFIQLALASIL
jgi:hypothetical protein